MNSKVFVRFALLGAAVVAPAFAVSPPLAQAVPFVASAPASPHTSWNANPVTLKGVLVTDSTNSGDTFTYDWDPGDGGSHCTGTVSNKYNISCAHTYSGAVGTTFTAVLKITDTTSALVAAASNCPPSITLGACYYTSLNAPPPNLAVEVNNAIDNGLWYLHTHMNHATSSFGAAIGHWYGGIAGNANVASAGDTGPSALHCTAFMVSGFLPTSPANPYTDDVNLCLAGVFDEMTAITMANITPTGQATFKPDFNANTIGIEHNGGDQNYQTGMQMDAIAAAGTLNALVPANTRLGSAASGKGTGPSNAYTFKDALIDGVDGYSYCQNSTGGSSGGWYYTCTAAAGDNSVSQWAAIGIIPVRRGVGTDPLSNEILVADQKWLNASFSEGATQGSFGYTGPSPVWTPWAVTPSGLVQMAMNGKGRGTTVNGKSMWDKTETYLRDNFGNTAGGGNSLKGYYYGMFSFTKGMLLHSQDNVGLVATPLTTLQSLDDPGTCASPGVPATAPGSGSGPCYPAIDWYSAQSSAYGGTDPTEGVARTLVNQQSADGSWFGHNYSSTQYYFETGSAIIMLNKTVFQAVPVACFTVNPNHIANGGSVTLDGGCSVEQNPNNHLTTWQWDLSGTNAGYSVGPGNVLCKNAACSIVQANFSTPTAPCISAGNPAGCTTLPYNYPVRLLLTDSGALTANTTGSVVISNPPNPPNANAGGPYNFCPNLDNSGRPIYAPFTLDGSKSTNPDDGKTDGTQGAPPSVITAFDWDYACAGAFNSAHGSQVDATSSFDVPANYGASFNICLRVTNNDNLAFPTAGLGAGLSSVSTASVTVHQPTDVQCSHCVSTLRGAAKAGTPGVPATIQVYWTDTNTSPGFPIDHYNIYRSVCTGSGTPAGCTGNFVPAVQIAGASSVTGKAGIPVSSTAGATLVFVDNYQLAAGVTYYYRVSPATAGDTETCQGNLAATVAVLVPKSGR
jgi:hypothetical protein